MKHSPLPSIGRITCLGCRRGRAAGFAGGCVRGGSGRTGPLQSARDELEGRHESALQVWIGPRRPSGHWAALGVQVVRVTPSRPFGSALGVATGWPARSTVRGGTHLAQAKGSLRPAPQASALPATPTGTGQSTRRLRQRGGACVRGRFLAEDGIYAKYTKYAK